MLSRNSPFHIRHRFGALASGLALLMLCLLQSACGYQPIYGDHGGNTAVAASLGQVGIDNIPERQGQMLRNNLIDRMYSKGRPLHPTYRLSINMHSAEQDVGILADSTSTRTELDMYVEFTLKDAKGVIIMAGSAHSVTSFSKLNQEYATLAGREDAIQRTTDEVSEQIINRLSLFFANPSPLPSAAKPLTPDAKTNGAQNPSATDIPQSIYQ